MPTAILIGLLILGLVAGFYFSHYFRQKAKELSLNNANSPVNLLLRQGRRQLRRWWAGLQSGASSSNDDQN